MVLGVHASADRQFLRRKRRRRCGNLEGGTYLIKAGHTRLVSSIAPLPLLFPVMKNVAETLYCLSRSRMWLVYMKGPSSNVRAISPATAQS